ncbi:MAG: PilZ domain-containing protein [Pseudomonadota bacterium]
MASTAPRQAHRPRELRRRVLLPARLCTGAQWSDTCILNISSRGLLIHSARPAGKGSVVELRRGDHVIQARVVWRDGARVGLQCDERLAIEQIVTLGQSRAFQLTAGESATGAPPSRAMAERSRLRGRALEYFSIAVIAVSIATSVSAMVETALARPLALIEQAFGNPQR